VLTLAPRHVDVWFTLPGDAAAPSLIGEYERLLSADEAGRYHRFAFDIHRHHFLVAHALLRTTLSNYASVDPRAWIFTTGPYGRPEVSVPAGVPALRFSLTHTDGLVAVAVTTESDIGIDAEPIGRRASNIDIARRYFAAEEAYALEALAPADRQRGFLDYWTLKEAYIKAIGVGLATPLDSFAIQRRTPPGIRFLRGQDDPAAWHLAQPVLSEAHVAALAVRCGAEAPAVTVRRAVPLVEPDAR
jgi:4'-phosphopantetheinyl transferase